MEKDYNEGREVRLLTVVLVTSNAMAAEAIAQMLDESGLFRLVYRSSLNPEAVEVVRAVRATDAEVLLMDLADWESLEEVMGQLTPYKLRVLAIGFLEDWTVGQAAEFERGGVTNLLRAPFSPQDLARAAYDGIHRAQPVTNQNILAFLPAKAGGGCSTVALHTAAALARECHKKVLLLEGDRHSGVLSILLNLTSPRGLAEALADAAELTDLAWRNYHETIFGLDVLLANPQRRGPMPSWAHYYQLLRFVQDRYEFIVADLPEVVNEATAEIVRNARGVMLVCTPELTSLKMAAYRCAELAECEVPNDRIHIILNRYERGGLGVEDAEKALGRPVFSALPNDYLRLRNAILESRVVAPDTPFGRACRLLAEKLGGPPEATQKNGRFSLLQKLGRIIE